MNYDITGEHYVLHFPECWDERAEYEMPSKGYLSGAWVELADGRRSSLFFFDPVRLRQELEMESSQGRPVIAEVGMVVVPEVTREAIRSAIALLIEDGYFKPNPDVSATEQENGKLLAPIA